MANPLNEPVNAPAPEVFKRPPAAKGELPTSQAVNMGERAFPPWLLPPDDFTERGHMPKAVYCYRDREGNPMMAIARFERGTLEPDRKTFRQWRWEAGRWESGLGYPSVEPPPLLLPELAATIQRDPDAVLWCVEGERCAIALRELGFAAVTLSGGSSSGKRWPNAAAKLAKLGYGRAVVLPDADTPGLKLAEATVAALRAEGVHAAILPATDFGLTPGSGEDVVDWLHRGGKAATLAALGDAALAALPETADPESQDELLDVAPPPPPSGILPRDIENYFYALAAERGCDPTLPVALCVAVLAGCLGQRVKVTLRPGWTLACILWHVVVGSPGVKKSPILRALAEPVYRLNRQRIDEGKAAVESWEPAKNQAKPKKGEPPPEPVGPRPVPKCVVVDDFTVEALVPIMEVQPSVLCAADELAGFFNGLGQYKKGGNDRQQVLKLRTGSPIVVNRKTEGARQVDKPGLSIAGGIQPAVAKRVGGSERDRDDGMCDRFNWFHVEALPPTLDAPPVPDYLSGYWENHVERFHALSERTLTLDPEAQHEWESFYTDPSYNAATCPPLERGMMDKLQDTLAPLAAIFTLASNPDPKRVTVDAMCMAIRYTKWTVEHNRYFLAQATGHATTDPDVERVVVELRKAGGELTLTELSKALRWDAKPRRLPAAIERLKRAGRIVEVLRPRRNGRGKFATVIRLIG